MIWKQLHSEFKVHFSLEKDLIHRGFDFITFKPFLIIFFLHEYMSCMQTILLSNCSICIASLTPFWLPSLALAMSHCVLLWGLYVVIRWNCYRVLTICWMLTINSIWNTSVFCIVTLYLKYYTENTGSNERIIIMKSSLDIRSGGMTQI